jgi:hypothetical protein
MLAKFTLHGSNAALVLLSAGILAAAAGGWLHLAPLLVVLGALLFTVTEYGTHRFLFHAKPSRWGWLRAKQHRLHYDHHKAPTRLDLLFLPLWYVLPNLALTAGLLGLVLRNGGQVASLVLGAMFALLYYEWVHLIAHLPYVPKTAAGRWMKRYHLRHHFVNEQLWFGVSNPLMDVLYRTYRDRSGGARSTTARVLYPGEPAPK